ncbi:TetR/AcrR family transcriptional regulator [Streptomyces cavernicola]|uniref:TetR/AcrR family transcriptional regulator n=1 Tax=Streptomyces cavernicola TaxID=3043613 RepID=A0ABT6SBT8_9ACTN|nr:TetR/AcrR family transcriptional regulator [Streptomyces sp. B-S-A6]MDI3405112.1 TetR/AcrR family transcriptional regulator [Streptomyces sp. B-S-A6]
MPPKFSAEEKARITRLLLDNGRRLFATQGLRKTSLEELVAPAGVAKSSFYAFFDSKEDLYLELMLCQSGEVKRKVIDGGLDAGTDTRDALRRFLRATLDELASSPLWSRLMTHPDEMQAVARKLDAERLAALQSGDNPVTALAGFVDARRAEGQLIDVRPELIVGVLQCVLLVPLFAERLGTPDVQARVLDLLVDIVSAGLAPRRDAEPLTSSDVL